MNIVGLALGIASSWLIMQYVRYEKSYDTFHSKSDRIYRMQYNNYRNVLEDIESEWTGLFPGNPFDYFFLDE